jgi:hypothetical protein
MKIKRKLFTKENKEVWSNFDRTVEDHLDSMEVITSNDYELEIGDVVKYSEDIWDNLDNVSIFDNDLGIVTNKKINKNNKYIYQIYWVYKSQMTFINQAQLIKFRIKKI